MQLQAVAEWSRRLHCYAVAGCGWMKKTFILLRCCRLWRNEVDIYSHDVAGCGGMKYSSILLRCYSMWRNDIHIVMLLQAMAEQSSYLHCMTLWLCVTEWSGNLYCYAVSGCGGMKWPTRRQKGWRCWRDLGMLHLMTWKKGLVANSL